MAKPVYWVCKPRSSLFRLVEAVGEEPVTKLTMQRIEFIRTDWYSFSRTRP